MPDPSALRATLADLYHKARTNPEQAQRATLPGGLQISVRIHGGRVHLQLARQGAGPGPSDAELLAVLNHWPAPDLIHHPPPTRTVYLVTSWPLDLGEQKP